MLQFDDVANNVAAHNVYPVSGEQVESILDQLETSFVSHVQDETKMVSDLLASSKESDPDAIAAEMVLQARRVPTRQPWASLRSRSPMSVALVRWRDRLRDWSDTHHNWSESVRAPRSPRKELGESLKRQATTPLSVRDLLKSYDDAVVSIVEELNTARTPEDQSVAARRIVAAIAIHDSVMSGTLCPLLEAVPNGSSTAARLKEGCRERALLQQRWDELVREVPPEEVFRLRRDDAEAILHELISQFNAHARQGTSESSLLLSSLPTAAYRTWSSGLDDAMWTWHGEGAPLLALRMALWGDAAPTRIHRAMLRFPKSRLVRSYFHAIDHFRDYWGEAWIERWLLPDLPSRPYAKQVPPLRGSKDDRRGEEQSDEKYVSHYEQKGA